MGLGIVLIQFSVIINLTLKSSVLLHKCSIKNFNGFLWNKKKASGSLTGKFIESGSSALIITHDLFVPGGQSLHHEPEDRGPHQHPKNPESKAQHYEMTGKI